MALALPGSAHENTNKCNFIVFDCFRKESISVKETDNYYIIQSNMKGKGCHCLISSTTPLNTKNTICEFRRWYRWQQVARKKEDEVDGSK